MENKAYSNSRWSLTELLPSTEKPVVDRAMEELEKAVRDIESLRPSLSPDMSKESFTAVLKALETFAERASTLGGYASLWFSENTQDQQALAFMGKVEQLLMELRNRILFLELWWKGLDAKGAERLLSYAGDITYYLQKQRLFSRFTLSEPEEKVITIKDVNGTNALGTLYEMITNKFAFELTVEGERKQFTRDALMVHVRSPLPETREAAYRELYRIYGAESSVLAQIYINRARDWANENISLRGFSSPISVRNLSNDIPDSVVDTLLDVCSSEAHVFHRYFRLKAKWLNMSKLKRFDIYAPLKKTEKKIPYVPGVKMVLDSFQRFAPEMRDLAMSIFEKKHIDAEIRSGKRGGAFCMSVTPSLLPWVLMNYTEEPRQVATLAHELGHAIHSLMARDHSVLTFHSALPLAETASVFSELLLTDRMLDEEDDPDVRRSLLAEVVDDTYATVLRQAFFVMFERDAHKKISEGCTADDLNALYLKNLDTQFGDSVDIDELFKHEWVSIPHIFHTPFYCYAYSFGQLLSLSLYQRYREEGESLKASLFKILSYGGSASPDKILSEAGINIADPGFWRGGFKVIEGMIDELERES